MNIYVVDDDVEFRNSLKRFLELYDFKVQLFANGGVFLAVAEDLTPGCLLLDLWMPELNGLGLQSALLEMGSHHQQIFMSGFGQTAHAVSAIRAGATDFLDKPYHPQQLLEAISRAEECLKQRRKHENTKVLLDQLTQKEQAVLTASNGGKASKLVADQLMLSIRTVEKHRSSIIHKLGVHNFAGALLVAAGQRSS